MLNETAYALGANRSCIRELFEYGRARAAIVGEENVFDYSLGNPSIPSPREVDEAVRAVLHDTDSLLVHGYTSAVGDHETRKAISDDLNGRYGVRTRPENFFLGCGAAPELVAVFRALSVPGGNIAAIAPYFPEYKPFVEGTGMELKVVPPDVPDFQIDLKALEETVDEHTQAVILNSPNNPSGVVYSRETLQALSRILADKSIQYGHPIYIVSDEPYRELAYGAEVPFVPAIYPNTIICYSYSKSLSLPGERIGYIYVPEEAADSGMLYAAIAGAARAGGHVCAPSLWQKVIARCAHLRPDLKAYDRNRTALYEALTAMGYEMAKPDGAFYLFIKAPGGDAMAFSQRAKEKDLLVVPGDGFGCPGYFRICYCVSFEMIMRSLPVFRELISVTLRSAGAGDAGTLAYIQCESWKSAFQSILSEENLIQRTNLSKTEAMYERGLSSPMIRISIEDVAGKPHCMAAWGRNRANLGSQVAELICIHSLPDKWRQGYGSRMMEHILSEIKEAGYSQVILWVFEKNIRARKFYEKHGFTLSAETQNHFGAEEVMYSRKL